MGQRPVPTKPTSFSRIDSEEMPANMDESPNMRDQRNVKRVSDTDKPWRINAAPQQQ